MRLLNKELACFTSILVFVASLAAQSSEALSIDRYLTKRAEMGSFSGAVLVMKDDKVVIRKGYGYADVEKRIAYTPETRHYVASITKMFTAMSAVILRDRGKLRLDDSICKYVKNCPAAWEEVKIEQLMHHTSGIPDYEEKLGLDTQKYLDFMLQPNSARRIVEEARKLPLNSLPGSRFHYSNTGYIILSMVISAASGELYEKFVSKHLLKPAGMRTANFSSNVKLPRNLAYGYTHETLPWKDTLAGVPLNGGHLKRRPVLPLADEHGDAALYMTVDDLYKWSKIMDGGSFISASVVKEAFTPAIDGYGYGWFVGKGFDRDRVRHNGALPGYISNIDKYTADRLTIILFCNQDRARLSNIARDVAAMMLGKPWDMPVQGNVITLTPEQISTLEGNYKMADGKILKIKNEPDFLTASLEGRYTAGLIPLSPTEFYFPLADGRAKFTLDAEGKAVQVNIRYSGEDHVAIRVAEIDK